MGMVARKGKSSYARENSRGGIDPGAASAAMLVRSAARAFGVVLTASQTLDTPSRMRKSSDHLTT